MRRASVLLLGSLLACTVASRAYAQTCHMTMCADGSHVRCCGAGCCPGAAPGGGGGMQLMFFQSLLQSIAQGMQQGAQRVPPAQPKLTPEQIEKQRAEAERIRKETEERERKRKEEEERRRAERQELLRTQKGEPLPEGPLPLKEGSPAGDEQAAKADPWCFENAPVGECDAAWEARCGKGPDACKGAEAEPEFPRFSAVSVMGEVLMRRAGAGEWIKVKSGDEFAPGDELKTGKDGALLMRTGPGWGSSSIQLRPESNFSFGQEGKASYWEITKGKARFLLNCVQLARMKCSQFPQTRVGNAYASVRGTVYETELDSDGTGILALEEGVVSFKARAQVPLDKLWWRDYAPTLVDSGGEAPAVVLTPEKGAAAKLGDDPRGRTLAAGKSGPLGVRLGKDRYALLAQGSEARFGKDLKDGALECAVLKGTVLYLYSGAAPVAATCSPAGSTVGLEGRGMVEVRPSAAGKPAVRVYSGEAVVTVPKK